MNESYVRTQVGALNEPWYALITKVGHPSASLVVLRDETSVFTFLTSTLRTHNFTPRQMGTFLSVEESAISFYTVIGQTSKSVHTDPIFRVVEDVKQLKLKVPLFDDMGTVQARKAFGRLMTKKEIKDELEWFAKSATSSYADHFIPKSSNPNRTPRGI